MTDDLKIEEMIRQREQAPIALEAERTALLIVDVQRFFTRPDSDFAQVIHTLSPGALDGYFQRVNSTVLPNISKLQNCFRSLAQPVIHCVFGSCAQDGQDLPRWLKEFDALSVHLLGRRSNPLVNGASWQIDEAVAPLPNEPVFNKTTSGALSSISLDQTLHNMGITSLVVCGLTTAVCVGLTARQMADRDFRVVIARDACTEQSRQMHEAALASFSHVFGQVRSTSEVMQFLIDAQQTTKTGEDRTVAVP